MAHSRYLTAIVASGTFLLAGCTPDYPIPKWIGRDADQFFAEFGPPKAVTTRPDGSLTYLWENRSVWRATLGQVPLLCRGYIEVGPDNIIRALKGLHEGKSVCPLAFGGT